MIAIETFSGYQCELRVNGSDMTCKIVHGRFEGTLSGIAILNGLSAQDGEVEPIPPETLQDIKAWANGMIDRSKGA